MGLVLAFTASLMLWIVLWAVGFGRVDDSFWVGVMPIMLIAGAVHAARASQRRPPDA